MNTRIANLTTGTPADDDYLVFDGDNGTKKVKKRELLKGLDETGLKVVDGILCQTYEE